MFFLDDEKAWYDFRIAQYDILLAYILKEVSASSSSSHFSFRFTSDGREAKLLAQTYDTYAYIRQIPFPTASILSQFQLRMRVASLSGQYSPSYLIGLRQDQVTYSAICLVFTYSFNNICVAHSSETNWMPVIILEGCRGPANVVRPTLLNRSFKKCARSRYFGFWRMYISNAHTI